MFTSLNNHAKCSAHTRRHHTMCDRANLRCRLTVLDLHSGSSLVSKWVISRIEPERHHPFSFGGAEWWLRSKIAGYGAHHRPRSLWRQSRSWRRLSEVFATNEQPKFCPPVGHDQLRDDHHGYLTGFGERWVEPPARHLTCTTLPKNCKKNGLLCC